MEELQSTENLDREILEDARKKAQRILKNADDTVKTKSEEWEQKLSAAMNELNQKYADNGREAEKEIMAALPVDKRRIKARKTEELLNAAVEAWYAALSRGRVLELIQGELTKRIADCKVFAGLEDAAEIHAEIHKIERTEAETILRKALPGKSCRIEEAHSASAYPELVIETPLVRMYASIGKTVDFYLGEKRSELLESLLGRDALLDRAAWEDSP